MTMETEMNELERLRAENARLKEQTSRDRTITMKVGDKGGVSVYGLGRWPVTLYKEQWERLLGASDEIRTFISANADRLKTKV